MRELERRTNVTRLGEGVDRTGASPTQAVERVLAACASYREAIDEHGAERVVAVLTSAVRDADNGAELERVLREHFGFEATTISGEREARLTFLGATAARPHDEPLMVLDIGGGSTEVVVGSDGRVEFFVSTQIGSVRYTERFLHTDPPGGARARGVPRGGAGRSLQRRCREHVRALPADGHRGGRHADVVRRDRPGARALRPRARRRPPAVARALRADPRAAGAPAGARSGGRSADCIPIARRRSSPAESSSSRR